MANILSAIGRLISRILSKVLGFLSKLFGELFWIILIIAIIYFAPAILAWLTAVGAPSFLVTAFEFISLASPYVVSAVDWVWAGGKSLVSSAWTAFKGAELGTQASIVLGASALLAPEETAEVIKSAADLALDTAGTVVSALGGSKLVWIAGAIVGYFVLRSRNSTGSSNHSGNLEAANG